MKTKDLAQRVSEVEAQGRKDDELHPEKESEGIGINIILSIIMAIIFVYTGWSIMSSMPPK